MTLSVEQVEGIRQLVNRGGRVDDSEILQLCKLASALLALREQQPVEPAAWQGTRLSANGQIDHRTVKLHKWFLVDMGYFESEIIPLYASAPAEAKDALPDIETVSAKVHEAWMQSKRAQGVESRKAEDGEELMVPYDQLSEKAKQLDRGTVEAVYAAIAASGAGK